MIERWAFRLASGAVARARWVVLIALAVVLAAAPGLLRLELRTDGRALVATDDPAVVLDARIRDHFGLRDPIVVLLETSHPAGIWNPETLRRVRGMTEALARLPGVGSEHVVSLATEKRDKVYPGTLKFMPFLDPPPETPELVEMARSDIAAVGILTGTLLSADGKAATVLVGVPPGAPGEVDRVALYRQVEERVRPFESATDHIAVVGAPVAEALLGTHILEDLRRLLPLAVGAIALAIWIACRRFWAVALALLKVAAILIFTFGLMGWVGSPVRLTSAMLPVLLTTMVLADEIHLFFRYQRRLAEDRDGPYPGPVLETMRQMSRPMVLTAFTTAIGFFSLIASPLPAVRSLGLFAGLGILAGLLWALTFTPAALRLLGPARMARPVSSPVSGRFTLRVLAPLLRRPKPTLAVLLLVTLVAAAGLSRLEVQDSWIDGFAPDSPFRHATDRADAKLLGTHLLLVQMTFDAKGEMPSGFVRKGPLLDPARLAVIGDFEAYVRRLPGVGGVLGAHSQLTTVHYLWMARREGARSLPESPERVEMLLDRFDMARGEARRREVVDDDLRQAIVTIFLKHANYRDTERILEAVRRYERERLAPAGVRLDFAGDVAVSQSMIPSIVQTQVSSLGLTLVGAFLAVALFWRSARAGLWVLGPCALGVLWVLGSMGWIGVPLGVATSMFCAIALGLGDYAVHFLEEVARAADEGHPEPALHGVEVAGPSIVADTLAIGLGFGLLILSQVPANARLGGLVAAALAASCVLTLVGLGALLAWLRRYPRAGAGIGTRSDEVGEPVPSSLGARASRPL
ncbi:MAG TPA: MMPL family transporter [Thermoanaerobaculia bacterium]|nr:MMPL family transporter [Thermoanaerobaculia bacterium]